MTDNEIMSTLFDIINYIINQPNGSVGNVTYTYNSKIVTGSNFITNATVQVNGYINSDNNDKWYKIQSIDSETQITLFDMYQEDTNTSKSYYSDKGLPIIRSNQNMAAPSYNQYLVIQKPFARVKEGTGSYEDRVDNNGVLNYTTHYNCTLSLEEVKGTGENLVSILDSLNRQDVKDYMSQFDISILGSEDIKPINTLVGNEWEDRAILDLYLLVTNKYSYNAGYISTVETHGTYNGTVNS